MVLILSASCSSPELARQHVQVSTLSFDVPAGWTRVDTNRSGLRTSIWSPPINDRSETITVVRSELAPATAAGGVESIKRLLTSANGFPSVERSSPELITTQQGMHGARIELDYVPSGRQRSYHRVHVVLVDQDALVHVLYTALQPDEDLEVLDLVLATIHRGEVRS